MWESILQSALVGAVIGGVVGLLLAILVRKTCPHCKKRHRLGMFGTRKICPHCGGKLTGKKKSTSAEK